MSGKKGSDRPNSASSVSLPEYLVGKWQDYEASASHRGEVIVSHLKQYTPLVGMRILDVGSGTGGVTHALRSVGAAVVGIDVDSARLEAASDQAKGKHMDTRIEWGRAAAEAIPFCDASIDVVVCNDVLEHVRHRDRVLREISRVLRPGGWLYLQFPNLFSTANLRRDPHYGLFGASILGPKLGAWYVVKLRRRATTYEVGKFPVASRVRHRLERLGVKTIVCLPAPKRRIGCLTPLLRLYRLNTYPLMTLICQKVTAGI